MFETQMEVCLLRKRQKQLMEMPTDGVSAVTYLTNFKNKLGFSWMTGAAELFINYYELLEPNIW